MDYLSQMLAVDRAVEAVRVDDPLVAKYMDKDKRAKDIGDAGRLVAESGLSAEDKAMFLCMIGKYEGNIRASGSGSLLKYAATALVSGGVGFGLGWYARGAYENGKREQARQIADMVMERMK